MFQLFMKMGISLFDIDKQSIYISALVINLTLAGYQMHMDDLFSTHLVFHRMRFFISIQSGFESDYLENFSGRGWGCGEGRWTDC